MSFERAAEAFEAVREQPEGERERLLAELLDGDEGLIEIARSMLRGDSAPPGFLRPPSEVSAGRAFESESTIFAAGACIGAFELQERVARGGMGEVWRAKQERPERIVALKALRTGLGDPSSRRRFEVEAEILARLDHPGIARVFASGLVEVDGDEPRPWFAMEWIEDARTIAEAAVQLPIAGRLELLREAALAVHHGHLRGVVHRDLKPDNLLVGRDGRVRVIDYGIARDEAVETRATGAGELVGTLRYMSPEQVRGDVGRIDVRTDVHALGVVLFELLSGSSPWTQVDTGWSSLAREVCDQDPRPLSEVGLARSGELQWIVSRALAKEPERRYPSVRDLADDLERYRREEPLAAGPPSLGYRTTKFMRRNRPWVIMGGLVAATLVAGLIATGWAWRRSEQRGEQLAAAKTLAENRADELERARRVAEDRAEHATTLNRFLDAMLRSQNPYTPIVEDSTPSTVGAMLDRATGAVGQAFADLPELEADTRVLLGSSYHGQGRYEESLAQYEAALELLRRADPPRPLERYRVERLVATGLGRVGRVDEGIERLRAALPDATRELGERSLTAATYYNDLGWLLQECGRIAESLEPTRVAVELFAELESELPSDNRIVAATAASNHARALRSTGDDERTESAYREAVRLHAAASGSSSLYTGIAIGNLSSFLYALGRYGESRDTGLESLEIQRQHLAPDHPVIATGLYNLASVFEKTGEFDRSESVNLELIDLLTRTHGPEHPETVEARAGLAYLALSRGDFEASRDGHLAYARHLETRGGGTSAASIRARIRAAEATERLQRERGEKPTRLEELYAELVEFHGVDSDLVAYCVSRALRTHAEDDELTALWSARSKQE